MQVHVSTTSPTLLEINRAIEIFSNGLEALYDQWHETILRRVRRDLARAWFSWTKEYHQATLEMTREDLIKEKGTYCNRPRYIEWTIRQLDASKALREKYVYAQNKCEPTHIVLDDAELKLLVESVALVPGVISDVKKT
jgi:hypothetical protein